ncbi:MAG TPA: alanine racemase, partial [Pyrinomonadaceae bacterium]|nr:alanine racemase [Pyrinomonadaceae bacterium]
NLLTADAETVGQLDGAAARAGATLSVFLKVDCGYHRVGVEPDTPEAVEIPRRIQDARHLRFAGILTHAGHSYHARAREELLALARHERDVMVELAARLRDAGVEAPTVSVGSTPTATHYDHLEGADEMRPGNYIFFDAFQATLGSCTFDDCALTVLASVVHRDTARRRVVIDAGAVALSKDRGPVEFDASCGYGRVLDLEGNDLGLRVGGLSQEHGEVVAPDDGDGSGGDGGRAALERMRVGSRVRVLANHSCLTAAQHGSYHVVEDGRVVGRWEIMRGW